jgi:predicted ATPase/DNA-binding XRE family transcriptional regulator
LAEVSFGEWLKRRRSALGLTQEQLARQIHCSTSALRKFESEERRPSAEVVEQLADIFGIPAEEHKSFLRFARGDWQAISSGEFDEAPWQDSRAAVRSNLPVSTTSFIGREKEQAEIIELIRKNRLVTLMGAGGIGKTRLSIQSASALMNDFPGGLWFVEFAPLSDPALVPQAIVSTLGLIEQTNREPAAILIDFLKSKKSLLILDNCEHLVQACAQLAETLLHACPDLHILATSRETLGIAGEVAYLVPSLGTPDPLSATLEGMSQFEAVQLFIERTSSVLPGFTATEKNASAIAQVCYHLDGIPLAIELAAARVKLLRVEEIAARLDDRFGLLTGGRRTALPRQQTLRAMIDWSHDLLTRPERILFRRLSIFAGGWTLEAAERVCSDVGQAEFFSHDVLDLLTSLVNKSLLLAERKQGQETRYSMLETIRQYAREKLWAAGEGEILRQRHLAYFVDLAERAEPNLRSFDMAMWLDRLEADLDNIRASLEYALESDIEAELRLASALLWVWNLRGPWKEGIDWLDRGISIEAAERGVEPLHPRRAMIRGKALNANAKLAFLVVEDRNVRAYVEESLTLFQNLGPAGKQGLAYALLRLADFPSASPQLRTILERSLALFREIEDKFGIAECLLQWVSLAQQDNDYKQAIRFAEEQLTLRQEIGDQDGIAWVLGTLGELAFWQNDYPRAITLHQESVALFREVGNKWAVGHGLSMLGDVFLGQKEYKQAAKTYEEALTFAQDLGERFMIAFNCYNLGAIAWFQGEYVLAIQMISDALTLLREVNSDRLTELTANCMHTLGDIAMAQGDDQKAVHWYEAELTFGEETQLDLSIMFALGGLGKAAWVRSDHELAHKRFEEGLRRSRNADSKPVMLLALCGLGRVALSQRDYDSAYDFLSQASEISLQESNNLIRWVWLKTYGAATSHPLEAFAILAAAQKQMGRTARLLGAAESLYAPIRFAVSARERDEHNQAMTTARAALGEEAFSTAYEEGKKMSLDEAVAYARAAD